MLASGCTAKKPHSWLRIEPLSWRLFLPHTWSLTRKELKRYSLESGFINFLWFFSSQLFLHSKRKLFSNFYLKILFSGCYNFLERDLGFLKRWVFQRRISLLVEMVSGKRRWYGPVVMAVADKKCVLCSGRALSKLEYNLIYLYSHTSKKWCH